MYEEDLVGLIKRGQGEYFEILKGMDTDLRDICDESRITRFSIFWFGIIQTILLILILYKLW